MCPKTKPPPIVVFPRTPIPNCAPSSALVPVLSAPRTYRVRTAYVPRVTLSGSRQDLLDASGRERLLIGPTTGLVTCPDFDVRSGTQRDATVQLVAELPGSWDLIGKCVTPWFLDVFCLEASP